MQKKIFIVQVNYLVIFCTSNMHAAWAHVKDRVSLIDLSELKSYAQFTRIIKKQNVFNFTGPDGLKYKVIKMPLYTKHAKSIISPKI